MHYIHIMSSSHWLYLSPAIVKPMINGDKTNTCMGQVGTVLLLIRSTGWRGELRAAENCDWEMAWHAKKRKRMMETKWINEPRPSEKSGRGACRFLGPRSAAEDSIDQPGPATVVQLWCLAECQFGVFRKCTRIWPAVNILHGNSRLSR